MLPGMFAHLAQLMGVRGLEEYSPAPQQVQQNQQAASMQQAGMDPRTGQPMNPADMATANNQNAQAMATMMQASQPQPPGA
jgi:hypothetical protein